MDFESTLDKILDIAVVLIAAILILLLGAFGFYELSVQALAGYALLVTAAGYLGVMVGRRSATANRIADLIEAQRREVEARTKEVVAKTRVLLHGTGLDRDGTG